MENSFKRYLSFSFIFALVFTLCYTNSNENIRLGIIVMLSVILFLYAHIHSFFGEKFLNISIYFMSYILLLFNFSLLFLFCDNQEFLNNPKLTIVCIIYTVIMLETSSHYNKNSELSYGAGMSISVIMLLLILPVIILKMCDGFIESSIAIFLTVFVFYKIFKILFGKKDSNYYNELAKLVLLRSEAIYYLEKALDLDSNNAETYFLKGKVYLNMKEKNLAILNFEKAVQIEPKEKYRKLLIKIKKRYSLAKHHKNKNIRPV